MATKTKFKKMDRRTVSVDIDGYIAEKTDYTSYDFINFKPIKEMIDKVNELYRNGYTVIYHTARPDEFYASTKAWLINNGCRFHALHMGKLRADFYLDDRNANIDDLE